MVVYCPLCHHNGYNTRRTSNVRKHTVTGMESCAGARQDQLLSVARQCWHRNERWIPAPGLSVTAPTMATNSGSSEQMDSKVVPVTGEQRGNRTLPAGRSTSHQEDGDANSDTPRPDYYSGEDQSLNEPMGWILRDRRNIPGLLEWLEVFMVKRESLKGEAQKDCWFQMTSVLSNLMQFEVMQFLRWRGASLPS